MEGNSIPQLEVSKDVIFTSKLRDDLGGKAQVKNPYLLGDRH